MTLHAALASARSCGRPSGDAADDPVDATHLIDDAGRCAAQKFGNGKEEGTVSEMKSNSRRPGRVPPL